MIGVALLGSLSLKGFDDEDLQICFSVVSFSSVLYKMNMPGFGAIYFYMLRFQFTFFIL